MGGRVLVGFGVIIVGSWSREYLGLIMIATRGLMGSEGGVSSSKATCRSQKLADQRLAEFLVMME